jgi:hypothetical protein
METKSKAPPSGAPASLGVAPKKVIKAPRGSAGLPGARTAAQARRTPASLSRRSQLTSLLADVQAELAALEESDSDDSQLDEVWLRCSMLWCSVAIDVVTLHRAHTVVARGSAEPWRAGFTSCVRWEVVSHLGSTCLLQRSSRYVRLDEGAGGAMGHGTVGRVYIAIDKVTNQVVAVKRQSVPSEAASREFAARSMLCSVPSPDILMMLGPCPCQRRQ